MKAFLASLFAVASAAATVENQKRAVSGTATVDLGSNIGTPKYLASGFIYGIPDTPNQIPDHFYTDIKFNYNRAGGAQVVAPGRGWIYGITEYKNRFASALSNYKTTRKYDGSFILLVHDLWGADSTQGASAPYPGDNNDWTSWDNYLTELIKDLKANSVSTKLILDIWNEPDLTAFWNRPQAQWIQLWGRAFHRFRCHLPLITGPSLSAPPGSSNTWWTNWEKFIASNRSSPDQYSWHMEFGGGDMQSTTAAHASLLNTYGLAPKQVNINEYGVFSEQVPSAGAWWIAQLERVNAIGLRGNWLSVGALHDFMAGLLGKPNAGTSSYDPKGTGYWPAAEFQVYKYYATNMTGYRAATLPTADKNGEVYAVVGSNKVRLLVGSRITTGTWYVRLNNLAALGLPSSGTLNIQTWGFQGNQANHFQRYDTYSNLGIYGHAYSGGTLTFPIFQVDTTSAYAFEFSI